MAKPLITRDMTLPEVLTRFPQCREVFDRYGLRGCGGPKGPPERLAYFASMHQVDEGTLLAELNEVARRGDGGGGPLEYREELADVLHRRFFKAGIVTILTVGALWGAITLAMIAAQRSFFQYPFRFTLAHAHAQIFGWVGFFVMGFAYAAFPRFKYTRLWRPDLANLSFWLMAGGIIAQVVAEVLEKTGPILALGIAAGLVQSAAITIFVMVILRTLRQSTQPAEVHDRYIVASLVYFWIQGLFNPVFFWLVGTANTPELFLRRIATWDVPYRDIQLLGFATLMIFGVSQRFLPHAYGLKRGSVRASAALFWVFNAALWLEVIGFVLFRLTHHLAFAGALSVASLAFAGTAFGMTVHLGLWGRPRESDRSLKFARAAYAWLLAATVMLLVMPIYNRAVGQAFSHAFFGAYRHALTVGFVSMMILGVAAKVGPTLAGRDIHKRDALWPTFVLLNLGNTMRIAFQILTDVAGPWAYTAMGVSGFIEVCALSYWAVDLWRALAPKPERPVSAPADSDGEFALTPQTRVAEVLRAVPGSMAILTYFGFTELQNPFLRNTVARVTTLEQACRHKSVDVEKVLAALRQGRGVRGEG